MNIDIAWADNGEAPRHKIKMLDSVSIHSMCNALAPDPATSIRCHYPSPVINHPSPPPSLPALLLPRPSLAPPSPHPIPSILVLYSSPTYLRRIHYFVSQKRNEKSRTAASLIHIHIFLSQKYSLVIFIYWDWEICS